MQSQKHYAIHAPYQPSLDIKFCSMHIHKGNTVTATAIKVEMD